MKEIAQAISEIRTAKVSIVFFVFLHTCKNYYKTQTCAPIALKCGTQKGSPKANPSIKFAANPMYDSGVMTDYSRKTRSIFFIGNNCRTHMSEYVTIGVII